ncbi:hypothetical protein F2P79_024937 [Pimephales promelas]|nr:hypothetical protein F2P79_024937 [Pimephales promelas]
MKYLQQWTVLFNKLINWNLECLIEKFADSKGTLALKTLPVILPPPVYKIGHKTFRPTIQEARTSFIDVQPSGTNMVLYLERQKEAKPFPFVLELGIAGQFFVVVNGEALEQSKRRNFRLEVHQALATLTQRQIKHCFSQPVLSVPKEIN